MKTFEIVIYDCDLENELEHLFIDCDSYGEMMGIAENLCQTIMAAHNLPGVCWNYKEVV